MVFSLILSIFAWTNVDHLSGTDCSKKSIMIPDFSKPKQCVIRLPWLSSVFSPPSFTPPLERADHLQHLGLVILANRSRLPHLPSFERSSKTRIVVYQSSPHVHVFPQMAITVIESFPLRVGSLIKVRFWRHC